MKDFVIQLQEKTTAFGNHHKKYIQAVNRYLDALIRRLEEKKKRDVVHIFHPVHDFGVELNVISNVGATIDERLHFMGTFCALQVLLMNQHAVDLLRLDALAASNKFTVYKRFMLNAGDNFRTITASYMKELLNIFIDPQSCPEFVVLGVGTKSDQDDIDVGIVDDGTHNREQLNRAIALMSQEMLRYATSLHFHLSEHIGRQHYSASIEEFKKTLKQEIGDFVIINEMLGAAVIAGSTELFNEFRNAIINRYFYQAHNDNRYHEGYLRGILGEINSLIARPISRTHLNFKEDALRTIKSIISAKKTVCNIDRVNAWDIIDNLKNRDTNMYHEYNALERSLTFFEIVRYLHQLFVTQDEEVLLDDVALKNIRRVARVLGYSDIGKCSAEEHLLVHYYEHVQNVRSIVPTLLNDIKKHLQVHSIFVPMFSPGYQGNIVQDFLQRIKFFKGTSFWDDVLDYFKNEELLKKFVHDLDSFPPDRKERFIKAYIQWGKYDLYSLIKLLTIVGKTKAGFPLYEVLHNQLRAVIATIPDVVRKIAYVFNRFPSLLNTYLSLGDTQLLELYIHILQPKTYERDIASIIDDLRYLTEIHFLSSTFFKRFFLRILDRYPECIKILRRPHELVEFANGIYSDVNSMPTFQEKKEKLGDYYDFEMVRVGLKTLSGEPVEETNAQFNEFSDNYLLTLFDICRQEIDSHYTKRIITDDLLAVFAAGGHARGQAYDDDYDIIVLLNSDNQEILSYCNKIINKINAEIIKRGTIPHHRFADYVGRFVILMPEIEQLLRMKKPDIFVEKSQLLSARMIVGSRYLEEEFLERIVKQYIFDRKQDYIKQMKNEITLRHKELEGKSTALSNNIKEGIGRLRDIEMTMLIIKAQLGMSNPIDERLFRYVAQTRSDVQADIDALAKIFVFLKMLRDVYRLTAGASDVLSPDALGGAARIMGYKDAKDLYTTFVGMGLDAKTIIDNLLSRV